MSGVEGRCGLCGQPWSQECIELSCEPSSAPTEQADGGVLTGPMLEAIAHNLCSLHDFDVAFVMGQERFARAVITEYERARPAPDFALDRTGMIATPPATPIAGGFGSSPDGDTHRVAETAVVVPRDQLETLRRSLELGNLLPGEGETLINCWIFASEAESKA